MEIRNIAASEARTFDATVNTLLYELRLYVWEVKDEFVFNKDAVLRRFLQWQNEV